MRARLGLIDIGVLSLWVAVVNGAIRSAYRRVGRRLVRCVRLCKSSSLSEIGLWTLPQFVRTLPNDRRGLRGRWGDEDIVPLRISGGLFLDKQRRRHQCLLIDRAIDCISQATPKRAGHWVANVCVNGSGIGGGQRPHVLEDRVISASAVAGLSRDAPGTATWSQSSYAGVCFLEAAEKRACLVAGKSGGHHLRLVSGIRRRVVVLLFGWRTAGTVPSTFRLALRFRHGAGSHLIESRNEYEHTAMRAIG